MKPEEDWAKRRQRAAKCKAHGLHYDPELTSGCALCRKEGLAAEPVARPQMVVMLLALLGIAVIGYRVWGPGAIPSESAAAPVAPPAPAPTAQQLDPALHQEALQGVDRALVETPGQSLADMGGMIRDALIRLSRSLRQGQEAEGASLVAALDELTERLSDAPFSLDLLRDLRTEWAELRELHFEPADWFLDPVTIDPRTDRAALTTYRDVASSLSSLLNEGWSQAELIVTPELPNIPKDEDRIRAEWQTFQIDWRRRVLDLRQQLPARPNAGTDPQILLATQTLEQAFSRAVTLTAATDVPSTAGIDDALTVAERARRSLDELLLR